MAVAINLIPRRNGERPLSGREKAISLNDGMTYDVVVVRGRSLGLMLACEPRGGGASVIVLEGLTEIDTTLKAGTLNRPTIGVLYRDRPWARLNSAPSAS